MDKRKKISLIDRQALVQRIFYESSCSNSEDCSGDCAGCKSFTISFNELQGIIKTMPIAKYEAVQKRAAHC